MSVPQSNSTYTSDRPMPETERTRATPGIPFMMLSIGNVTSCSTSCGAKPSASVINVTIGRLRSGKTSIGIRGRTNEPRKTSSRAAARTKMRLRRLAETRVLNTDRLLADLIDQLGAAHHDAVALPDAAHDRDTGRVERLRSHRARLELLRLDVPPDHSFAVAGADHRIAADDHAGNGIALLRGHGHRLADPDRGRRIGDL